MNVFVIGIGLIGGSMVTDIKEVYPEAVIFGIDKNGEHLKKALDLKLIDDKAVFEDLDRADIVIISVPVDVSLDIIPKVLNKITSETIVFDVGSTKKPICDILTEHPKRQNFIATHPIAGTEFSGPTAALKNLFRGKVTIICEIEKTAFKLQKKALELFQAIGMQIRYMNPISHDKHIAYMSHLSHISSFMLGKTVIDEEQNEKDIFDMAGSGFASTVRLAKSSPEMWTPIFQQNKKYVIEGLEAYINNLSQFKTLLMEDNYEAIYNDMQNVNKIKEILNGIETKK